MNSNPYGYTPYPSYNRNTYAFVNGIEGAKAYPMSPNQMVMLMDSDSPLCFKKQSDNTGKATLQCFKLVEMSEDELRGIIPNSTSNEISALNKRIDELAELINSLKKEESK
jgi:hypothetical protein